jgi:undecaprenyl diphosphate synthase
MNETTINCLGFIMDGNRRWAKEQDLPTMVGHKEGGKVMRESLDWVHEAGIKDVVYYAFSTENWQRSKEEVDYLMELFAEWLVELEDNQEPGQVKFKIVGHKSDFSTELQSKMTELETRSDVPGTKLTVWVALSYGGRSEIISAVNQAVKAGEVIDEESFNTLLWTAEMPDPDLIVRTGGEQRLSNFMTWKSVYSELLFIDKYWPALTKDDFKDILHEYESRERRRGR